MFLPRRFQGQITQLISGEKRIGSNLIWERQLRHFIILEPWERGCQTRGKVIKIKKTGSWIIFIDENEQNWSKTPIKK